MSKVLIINQSTIHPSYQKIDEAACSTWGSLNHPDVEIVHYYGKYDDNFLPTSKFSQLPPDGECLLEGNKLIVGTYDTFYPQDHYVYQNVLKSELIYNIGGNELKINDPRGEKFILALEYCLNNFEFDFIQRISCTSYVDMDKMIKYVDTLPKIKVYNGAKNMYNNEYYFIAGHNVLMSRDVVQQLVEHKKEYLESPYPEDLATGKLLFYDLKYVDFFEQDDRNTYTHVEFFSNLEEIKLSINPSVYLYRVRINHSEIFHHLHQLMENNFYV